MLVMCSVLLGFLFGGRIRTPGFLPGAALSLFTKRNGVLAQPYADAILVNVQGSLTDPIR